MQNVDFKKIWRDFKNSLPKLDKNFFFWNRPRYRVNLSEDEKSSLRSAVKFFDDETPLVVIDDSLFITGAKNTVFTNKRILWQPRNDSRYKSILLADFDKPSVFAKRVGRESVVSLVDEKSSVLLRFQNIRAAETLRMTFHDFLTRNCAGYSPFSEENARRYKEYVSPTLRQKPRREREDKSAAAPKSAAAAVFTYISLAAFICLAAFDAISLAKSAKIFSAVAVNISLTLIVISWAANILCPLSKSKLSKLFLLALFSLTCVACYCFWLFHDGVPIFSVERAAELGRASLGVEITLALLWLLFDNMDFDLVTEILFIAVCCAVVLAAIVCLGANVVFAITGEKIPFAL